MDEIVEVKQEEEEEESEAYPPLGSDDRDLMGPPPSERDRERDRDDEPSSSSSHAPPRRSERRQNADRALPMPHNGPAAGQAVDDDEGVMHLPHPLWRELFSDLGTQPATRPNCWGCRRGALNIRAMPYEGYTNLAKDLPSKVVEHGLYAAAVWAGEYYLREVLGKIVADPAVIARSQWNGASIVWHFFKHTNIAQFRLLGEELELSYASDFMINKKFFMMPQFGDAQSDTTLDPSTVRTLSSLRAMLHRIRQADPKKTITYHHGLGITNKASSIPIAKEQFTGKGLLHS